MSSQIVERLEEISAGIAEAYGNNSQLPRLTQLDEKPTSPGTGWAPIEVTFSIRPRDVEDAAARWQTKCTSMAMAMVIAEERHLLTCLRSKGEYGTMQRSDPDLGTLHNAVIDLKAGASQPNAVLVPKDLSGRFRDRYPVDQHLPDFDLNDEELTIAWTTTADEHIAVYERAGVLWEAVTFGDTGRLLITIDPNIGGITGVIKVSSYARVGVDEDRVRVIRLDAHAESGKAAQGGGNA